MSLVEHDHDMTCSAMYDREVFISVSLSTHLLPDILEGVLEVGQVEGTVMPAVLDEKPVLHAHLPQFLVQLDGGHAEAIAVLVAADEVQGELAQIRGVLAGCDGVGAAGSAVAESPEEGDGAGEQLRMPRR